MDMSTEMYMMQCFAFGAVTFQICELLSYLKEEIEYFWESAVLAFSKVPAQLLTREKYTLTKGVYLWSRYFPIVAQMFNIVITHMAQISYPHTNSAKLCSIRFVFKSVLAQMTLEAIEAILMVRLHALYNCSRRTGTFLICVFIFNVSMRTYANTLSIRSLIAVPSCVPPKTPRRTLVFFGVAAVLGQSVIFIMTVGRCACFARSGRRRCPLALLMLRDGAYAYVLLFVIISVMVSLELMRSLTASILGGIFVWYVAIVSAVGCRIVLNVCRLLRQNPLDAGRVNRWENEFPECASPRTTSPVFTSIEDLDAIESLGHSGQSTPATTEECAMELNARRSSATSAPTTGSPHANFASMASCISREQKSAAETSNDAIDADLAGADTNSPDHHSLSSPPSLRHAL